ncbi:MAG: carboxypeptidase-like regulatory domain-containing protein [Pyrinomonadaceae bacterium]
MRILAILGLVLFCSAIVGAQQTQKLGRVKIILVDEAGGIISETRVTLTGNNGKQFVGLTNDDGESELSVPEGKYSLAAEYTRHNGWKKYSMQRLVVSRRQQMTFRIVLKVNPNGGAGGLIVTSDPKPKDKEASTSILTGRVYDANGALVPFIKVVARNVEGKIFETTTNDDGIYKLTLPFNKYGVGNFREAKYDIIVGPGLGFQKSVTKDFVFIPSQFGEMHLDIALEIGRSG